MLAKLYNTSRAAERHVVETDATLRGHDQAPVDILVANISSTGCLFVCPEALEMDTIISIGIPNLGRRHARVVRVLGQHYGCEFLNALRDEEVLEASTSNNTVVPFPVYLFDFTVPLSENASDAKLPGWARLAILFGGIIIVWLCIITAVLHIM